MIRCARFPQKASQGQGAVPAERQDAEAVLCFGPPLQEDAHPQNQRPQKRVHAVRIQRDLQHRRVPTHNRAKDEDLRKVVLQLRVIHQQARL